MIPFHCFKYDNPIIDTINKLIKILYKDIVLIIQKYIIIVRVNVKNAQLNQKIKNFVIDFYKNFYKPLDKLMLRGYNRNRLNIGVFKMKLWIDDCRTPPKGYHWCKSVNKAKRVIEKSEDYMLHTLTDSFNIELIDIDHDARDFASDGGDYIKLLDWLEETGRNYPIHIHSMNVVGVQNMRAIIQRNGWEEV